MQVKITVSLLKEQRYSAIRGGIPIRLHDSELRGFGCYINVKGDVSWFVQKHIAGRGGKQIRTVIGHWANMSIDEARRQATIDLGKIAQGEDISLRKKARLEHQKKIVGSKTLKDLFDAHVAEKLKEYNGKESRYWKRIESEFKTHVEPQLGAKTKIIQLSRD